MNIITVNSIEELRKLKYQLMSEVYPLNGKLSDIFNGPISHSFRVYDMKGNTTHFIQYLKTN